MDVLQWAITTVVGILGIIVGRVWQKHDRTLEKDKITFTRTLEMLPSQSGAIFFLRTHDFGSAFEPIEDLKELRAFRDHCSRPEFFYLDKELEGLRKNLLDSFNEFDDRLAAEASSWGLNPGFYRIRRPEDYEDVSSEKFHIVRNELNNRAKLICEKYDQLIKTAHRKL
jgi:hypothetical protein